MEAKIMGILNVTPDSFSNGGRFRSVNKAVAHGLKMIKDGADIIDVGGESSGPTSVFVPLEEELARVIPVIKALKHGILSLSSKGRQSQNDVVISVDTYKAEVARQAIAAGANMINDVTALRGDPHMAKVVAQSGVPVILMYSKDKTARTTRDPKKYKDVIKTVKDFLAERIAYAFSQGIKKSQIIIDPGMGAFVSGDPKYSFEILRRLNELKKMGYPILIGTSLKSFLPGTLQERHIPTLISNIVALRNGADIVRVHDVASHHCILRSMN